MSCLVIFHFAVLELLLSDRLQNCFCYLAGDVRNDMYVTLIQGEFRRGNKMAEKNVEVTITVCNQQGEEIQVNHNI